MLDGIIVINKPKGCTSHDVVDKVRDIVGVKKVGHTGTLDPEAEGIRRLPPEGKPAFRTEAVHPVLRRRQPSAG